MSEAPHECKHGVWVSENAEQRRQCALCISEAGDALWGRMATMLRELEWANGMTCPTCGAVKHTDQHSPDCRLAALLAALRDDTTPAPLAKNPGDSGGET